MPLGGPLPAYAQRRRKTPSAAAQRRVLGTRPGLVKTGITGQQRPQAGPLGARSAAQKPAQFEVALNPYGRIVHMYKDRPNVTLNAAQSEKSKSKYSGAAAQQLSAAQAKVGLTAKDRERKRPASRQAAEQLATWRGRDLSKRGAGVRDLARERAATARAERAMAEATLTEKTKRRPVRRQPTRV